MSLHYWVCPGDEAAQSALDALAAPGAPHIYCSESGPMNMATASIDYQAVEKGFLCIALAQMARRYGLPSLVADSVARGDAMIRNYEAAVGA